MIENTQHFFEKVPCSISQDTCMELYMDHVCTHVSHLDLVNIVQNMSATVEKTCEKIWICWHYSHITCTFLEICPISAPVFFFILTLHTLRQLLDWPCISILTSEPMHGTRSGPSKKNIHVLNLWENHESQKFLNGAFW